jgi:hypothetical protein
MEEPTLSTTKHMKAVKVGTMKLMTVESDRLR